MGTAGPPLNFGNNRNVSASNIDGRSPLLIAAKGGRAAVVELLVGQLDIYSDVEDFLGTPRSSTTLLTLGPCKDYQNAVMRFLGQALSNDVEGCDSREAGDSAKKPTAAPP